MAKGAAGQIYGIVFLDFLHGRPCNLSVIFKNRHIVKVSVGRRSYADLSERKRAAMGSPANAFLLEQPQVAAGGLIGDAVFAGNLGNGDLSVCLKRFRYFPMAFFHKHVSYLLHRNVNGIAELDAHSIPHIRKQVNTFGNRICV